MPRKTSITLILTMIGCGIAVTTHASTRDDWTTRVKNSLQPYVNSYQNVGFIVGGIEQGQEFQVALGSSVFEGAISPSADTVFQIGSATKTFTSLLLAELVGENRVSLNDPISKFFPEISEIQTGPVGAITLVQLSTHTSGLPRLPANFVSPDPNNPYTAYTPDLLLEALKQPGLLPHPGPYPINYSNMGVGLLGYVLSRVTGESYSQLIAERITGPLGMRSTGVIRNSAEIQASAQGYDETLTPAPFWDFLSSTVGAGGIFSTLSDMLRYLRANLDPDQSSLGNAITLTHQVQAYGSAQSVGIPTDSNIGLAWILNSIDGHQIIWHNGEAGGFVSFSGIDETTHEAIEVLTNTANGDFQGCVYDLLLDRPCPPPSSYPLSDSQMQKMVGTFNVPGTPAHTIQVSQRENFLIVTIDKQTSFRLFPTGANQFQVSVDAVGTLVFAADASGALNQLTLTIDGEASVATRAVITATHKP